MCPNCIHLFPFPRGGHWQYSCLENPCEEPGGLLSLGVAKSFPFFIHCQHCNLFLFDSLSNGQLQRSYESKMF